MQNRPKETSIDNYMSLCGFCQFRILKHFLCPTTQIATACLITAMVSISGYLTSCDELQYETRRQVLGRTTLGKTFHNVKAANCCEPIFAGIFC